MNKDSSDPKKNKEKKKESNTGPKALTEDQSRRLKAALNKSWLLADKAPNDDFKEI